MAHEETQLWEEDLEGFDADGPILDDNEPEALRFRGLQSTAPGPWADHEDVPTNVTGDNASIEADWAHDYNILKPIIESRGFNVTGKNTLCELPQVYCASGYRRRQTEYAKTLMGNDWEGKEYQVVLTFQDKTQPSTLDASLFKLKRVGFFQVYVNAGAMPAGIETLSTAKMIWIEGNRTHGIEGDLPANFWALKSRMFLLAEMGPQFTGTLESDLPMCEHLDYRLYLYRLQGFNGDVTGLKACRHVKDLFEVFLNPHLGGNVWSTMLAWDSLAGTINLWGSNFQGKVPFATSSTTAKGDKWADWCRARTSSTLSFRISQEVNGVLPGGLDACSHLFTKFQVDNAKLFGNFPLNLEVATKMGIDGIRIGGNQFTGPIPAIPYTVQKVDFHGGRWSGGIPSSWFDATGLTTVDLSDCAMDGPIPDMPPSVKDLKLSGNRLTGQVPASWAANTNFESIDLSGNQIQGAPFTWGWVSADPMHNYDVGEFLGVYKASPTWPLKVMNLDNNPLGISAGFLLGMMVEYELKELHVSNCSLGGWVHSEDVYSKQPKAGGGVENRLGGLAFDNLEKLDVSYNDIVSFGFNDVAGNSDNCWQEEIWTLRLPRLSTLNLAGARMLEHLNPLAFALPDVNLRDTPRLIMPEAQSSQAGCQKYLETKVSFCASETWKVCPFLSPVYTASQIMPGYECGKIQAERADGSIAAFQATPELLAPEVFCKSISANSTIFIASDDDTTMKIWISAGVAFLILMIFTVAVFFFVRRQRKAARQEKDVAQAVTRQASAATKALHMAAGMDVEVEQGEGQGPIIDDKTSALTEQIFADMDLAEIVSVGFKEHWILPQEHISFQALAGTRSGGFGEVKFAKYLGSSDVAVKVPHMKGNKIAQKIKASHAQSLVNEMRLFRRIRHPNIVLFHGVTALKINDSVMLCLVLEWIESGDYGGYAKKRRKSGEWETDCQKFMSGESAMLYELKVLQDVARGMQYLHGQTPPIMHRDLKPGNVLIELPNPPKAKLADFGLSTLLQDDQSGKAGTLSYMAPEVSDNKIYGLPADAFSFGCLCLFTLKGERPEAGKQQDECVAFVGDETMPLSISEVAEACLRTAPTERPDFAEIYERIENDMTADKSCNPSGGRTHSSDTGTSTLGRSSKRTTPVTASDTNSSTKENGNCFGSDSGQTRKVKVSL